MDGEMVLSVAEWDGLNPKTYRLMLMETIERREREAAEVEKDRESISENLKACEAYRDKLLEEIVKLKSKLVKEYLSAGEKAMEG